MRSQFQPIGLDIGTDSVRMLQLETRDATPAVHVYARSPMPQEASESPQLRLPLACEIVGQMLRHNGFAGRRVVAALPRELVQVKNLRLPMMPASELASAVEFEARNIFPFDIDQAKVCHLHAGEVRQGGDSRQEVIVLAAKTQDVENFLEMLHRAGALVDSLDFEPCALYRTVDRFIRRREDEQDVHVLLDIGVAQTQVVIGRGHEIHFIKPIEIGAARLNDAVARTLGVSTAEARSLRRRLIESDISTDAGGSQSVRQAVNDAIRCLLEELGREISLCLRYFSVTFRGQRPTRVRVLGGEANDPQVISVLGSVLSVPVEPGRPLNNIDTSRMKPHDRRGYLSEWAVAMGLGLKLTQQCFAARDGKPRDPTRPIDSSSAAEVIDLNRALGAAPPSSSVSREAANA